MSDTPKYERITIKFRDIPDAVNRKPKSRTFQSRLFNADNDEEERRAFDEMWLDAKSSGFTRNEVLKVWRQPVEVPKLTPD